MTTRTALILVAGFVAGCGAAAIAPLVIPPANAQTTTRWETLCVYEDSRNFATTITAIANRAGAEGWEPFALTNAQSSGAGNMCFKRPAP